MRMKEISSTGLDKWISCAIIFNSVFRELKLLLLYTVFSQCSFHLGSSLLWHTRFLLLLMNDQIIPHARCLTIDKQPLSFKIFKTTHYSLRIFLPLFLNPKKMSLCWLQDRLQAEKEICSVCFLAENIQWRHPMMEFSKPSRVVKLVSSILLSLLFSVSKIWKRQNIWRFFFFSFSLLFLFCAGPYSKLQACLTILNRSSWQLSLSIPSKQMNFWVKKKPN